MRKEVEIIKLFLIETKNYEVNYDFTFELIQAIRYNNWYSNETIYQYKLIDTTEWKIDGFNEKYKDYIPVGSVEFVLDFLRNNYSINNIKPLNIPPELMKPEYLKRWVKILKTTNTIINAGEEPIFVKDNTKIKGFTNIVTKNYGYPAGEWLISEVVDIKSEWRVFVNQDQLVGLQNYSGDFTMFPDVELINKIIDTYKGKNPAYTLDVGINDKGTFVLECHDFFSCGLYGFSDYIALPRMFIATWNKLIRKDGVNGRLPN